MKNHRIHSTVSPCLILLLLFAGFMGVNSIAAESHRRYLREASGEFEGRFFATLRGTNLRSPIEFVAKGYVKLPVGKGKGKLDLVPSGGRVTPPNGEKTKLPARVKKALVRQGGNKVVFRGKNEIPARLAPNLGAVRGPFHARVSLKENIPVIKTKTTMRNANVTLRGPFMGKMKD